MLPHARLLSRAQSGMISLTRLSSRTSSLSNVLLNIVSRNLSTRAPRTPYEISNAELYSQHLRRTTPRDTNLESLIVLTYPSTRVLQMSLPSPPDLLQEILAVETNAVLPSEIAAAAIVAANKNFGGNVLSLELLTKLQNRLDIYQENTAITCVFFASKSLEVFSGGLFSGEIFCPIETSVTSLFFCIAVWVVVHLFMT